MSQCHQRRWMTIIASVLLLSMPAALRAANPRAELLRLVPEDVGFCLVLQDLREHGTRLADSPLARAFRASPLGRGKEWHGMETLDEFLRKQLGVDAVRLRDEILGDAVVLAYRPGPPGKPQQEQGLILVDARDAKLLEKLVDTINRAQQQSGEIKELVPCEHQGEKYFRRVQEKGDDFFALRGGKLLLATKEEMLREALGRFRESRSEESPLEKQFRTRDQEARLASLWINPRAFDAEMQNNQKNASGKESAFLKNFLRYWQAIDSVLVTIDLDSDVRLSLTLQAHPEAMPAAARKFFETAARPSDLLSRLPEDAFAAAAGRLRIESLFEMIGEFLPAEDNEAFRTGVERTLGAVVGKDFFKDVVPHLGPACALCIAPPPSSDKNWFPHVFVALGLGESGQRDAAVEDGLLDVLDFAVGALVVSHNQEHNTKISIRSAIQDKVKVKYLVGDQVFPPGFRPAYSMLPGYLTFGSSPDALERCRTCLAGKAPPRDNQPLLWISVKHIRAFLKDRRDAVTEYLAQKDRIEPKEAQERLDGLLNLLEMVDRIELSQQIRPGTLNVTLRVQAAQSLKQESAPK